MPSPPYVTNAQLPEQTQRRVSISIVIDFEIVTIIPQTGLMWKTLKKHLKFRRMKKLLRILQ